MEFDMKTLGSNIRAERSRLHMSQAELAKAIGSSPASITGWELGTTVPLVDSVYAMAQLFNTTVDELCGHGRQVA